MSIQLPDSVVVMGPKAPDIATLLRRALPDVRVLEEGVEPEGPYALIGFTPGPEIARYRNADWVHIAGAGANTVLARMAAADMHPRLITRTLGRMGAQIGEYVLSYIFADLQKHAVRRCLQADRNWDVPTAMPELAAGRSALILGTGGIGTGVANALRAVGMRVSGASRRGTAATLFDRVDRFEALSDMTDVDVIVGALPLTPQTDGIMGEAIFSKFNRALFINVGRGATADVDAVVAALADGSLRHAVLDVVPKEPLPEDSPLWEHPGITITPHVSGITLNEDTVAAFVGAYRAIEGGEEPPLVVDPAAGY